MTSPSRSLQSRLGQKFTSDSDLINKQVSSSVTTAPLSSPYHSDPAPNQSGEYHVLDQILNDLTPAPATTTSPSHSSASPSIKTDANVGLEQVVTHSRQNSSHYSHYSSSNRAKQVNLHCYLNLTHDVCSRLFL